MNCREARSLFSARIDQELSREETAEQDRHFSVCAQCRRDWAGFQTTVNLMHRLPVETPHPAFVGQVLDRVRAYEAQAAPTFLDPADQPWVEPQEPQVSRWARWRATLETALSWPRPIPVAFASALVLGVVIGFVATRPWTQPGAQVASVESAEPGSAMDTLTSAQMPVSTSPFHDLVPYATDNDTPVAALAHPVLPSDPAFWNSQQGLQQQVRTGSERVRITF